MKYFCAMLSAENALISSQLADVCFCCDLDACKGACCVEGDAGAPITEEEISVLEDVIDLIKPFMSEKGLTVIDKIGVFEYDNDGNFVTPLVNNRECAFVVFENEIAFCAIEKAWKENAQPFRKPVSCHLYPIRITPYDGFDAINYHEWHICKPALKKGKELDLPLYRFTKDALIRKYGEDWYNSFYENLSK
jgi:hypothetical protein